MTVTESKFPCWINKHHVHTGDKGGLWGRRGSSKGKRVMSRLSGPGPV